MIRTILAFIVRDLRREVSYRLSFFIQMLGFLPVVVMFYYLSRLVGPSISGPLGPYGGSYFPFALIGISVHNYLTLALSSFTGSLGEISNNLLVLGLWALVGLPLSIICFRLALRRTRVLGTMGHY
jgi:hypothetical protein